MLVNFYHSIAPPGDFEGPPTRLIWEEGQRAFDRLQIGRWHSMVTGGIPTPMKNMCIYI